MRGRGSLRRRKAAQQVSVMAAGSEALKLLCLLELLHLGEARNLQNCHGKGRGRLGLVRVRGFEKESSLQRPQESLRRLPTRFGTRRAPNHCEATDPQANQAFNSSLDILVRLSSVAAVTCRTGGINSQSRLRT